MSESVSIVHDHRYRVETKAVTVEVTARENRKEVELDVMASYAGGVTGTDVALTPDHARELARGLEKAADKVEEGK